MRQSLADCWKYASTPHVPIWPYCIRDRVASFVVADMGRGVFSSLAENPSHRDMTDHCEALRRVIRPSVSRHRESRGNGFDPIFKALAGNWGFLRFRSRAGCRTLDGMGLNVDVGTNHYPPELPGFQVSVTCRCTETVPAHPVV